MLLHSQYFVIDKTFFLSLLNKIYVTHFIACFIPLLHTLTFKSLFFNTLYRIKLKKRIHFQCSISCFQNDIKLIKRNNMHRAKYC